MGILKIEVEIPEFKRELSIEITLKKDGEVSYQDKVDTSYHPITPSSCQVVEKNTTGTSKSELLAGGNMMNLDY